MDFNQPLSAFEPQIKGVRNLINSDSRVFNLADANPLPWDVLIRVLTKHFGLNAKSVSLQQWVDEVRQSTMSTPAARLLGFFEALRAGKEVWFQTYKELSADATSY